MKTFLFLIVFVLGCCFSCKNDSNEHVANEGIDYYENGNIKSIKIQNESYLDELILRFNVDSELAEVGHFFKGKPIGLFSYYIDTYLMQQRQYIIVDSSRYINQYWSFDIIGNIIREKSNYFSISVSPDTVACNELLILTVYLECPQFDGDMNIVFGDFDDNFVLKDTSSIQIVAGKNRVAKKEFYFNSPGDITIRGCVDDYKIIEGMAHSRYMYFEKSIVVTN